MTLCSHTINPSVSGASRVLAYVRPTPISVPPSGDQWLVQHAISLISGRSATRPVHAASLAPTLPSASESTCHSPLVFIPHSSSPRTVASQSSILCPLCPISLIIAIFCPLTTSLINKSYLSCDVCPFAKSCFSLHVSLFLMFSKPATGI